MSSRRIHAPPTAHLRTAFAARMILAAAAVACTAAPSLAQQVTLFSETFESYTTGQSLMNQGAANWSSASGDLGATIQWNGAHTNKYLYLSGGNALQATTTGNINRTGTASVLTFKLRYTGDNGLAPLNETLTDGMGFNEFESNDGLIVQYKVASSDFVTLRTFAWNLTTYRAGFALVTITLPSAARDASLQLRFMQPFGGGVHLDQWALDDITLLVTVPEPGTWALFAIGACGLAVAAARRRRVRRLVP